MNRVIGTRKKWSQQDGAVTATGQIAPFPSDLKTYELERFHFNINIQEKTQWAMIHPLGSPQGLELAIRIQADKEPPLDP